MGFTNAAAAGASIRPAQVFSSGVPGPGPSQVLPPNTTGYVLGQLLIDQQDAGHGSFGNVNLISFTGTIGSPQNLIPLISVMMGSPGVAGPNPTDFLYDFRGLVLPPGTGILYEGPFTPVLTLQYS